ncbi:Ger(x)C family spore germination protein [Paenibacillus glycanilyticus]|uniref:Ger(x)C family spore germination protein n=1 Tax=Paenibacillus glycanilyticus TaxID=126569 RepID=UPI00203D966D|nr:Ger(x)C family spore germination protein [Paenibacillus glycanilyticus]MCM3628408.1 Ger(x)C family spore germination protein [Paenibacillus glycanilyticus]
MKRLTAAGIVLSVLLLTGCWDRTEINHYAFWMGTFMDRAKDNEIRVSAQIAVPSQIGFSEGSSGSGEDQGSIVVSATAPTLLASCQLIQDKLPRRLFIGHRRAVFIGQSLAESGIRDLMDMYTRNLETSFRTSVFIVIGEKPERVLEMKSPFEPLSSSAAVDIEKYSKNGDKSFRDFIVAMKNETTCPVLSVINTADIENKKAGQVFEINRLAIFNKKTQLAGILDPEDSLMALRVMARLNQHIVTQYISKGDGYVTLFESNQRTRIQTKIEGGQVSVHIKLTGTGTLRENRTKFDLLDSKALAVVQKELNEGLSKEVLKSINKVQSTYGTDIFGFGDAIHQQHPGEWQKLKGNWEQTFPHVKVFVDVNLHIVRIGAQGSPT